MPVVMPVVMPVRISHLPDTVVDLLFVDHQGEQEYRDSGLTQQQEKR